MIYCVLNTQQTVQVSPVKKEKTGSTSKLSASTSDTKSLKRKQSDTPAEPEAAVTTKKAAEKKDVKGKGKAKVTTSKNKQRIADSDEEEDEDEAARVKAEQEQAELEAAAAMDWDEGPSNVPIFCVYANMCA